MSLLVLVLVIILIVVLVGGMPSFGYHQYGWGPSGFVGLLLIALLIFLLLKHF